MSHQFTNETAVFDLLDISLVHGWLVDPQDAATTAALGQRSYNEVGPGVGWLATSLPPRPFSHLIFDCECIVCHQVVMALVTTLGREATPRQLTPTASMARGTGSGRLGRDAAPSSDSTAATPAALAAAPAEAAAATGSSGMINAGTLAAALQNLHVSTTQGADSPALSGAHCVVPTPALSGAPTTAGSTMSDATRSQINHMLSDLIRNAFASDALSSSTLTAETSSDPGSRPGVLAGASGCKPAAAAGAGAGGPPPAALARVAEAAAEVAMGSGGGSGEAAPAASHVQLLLAVEDPGAEMAAAGGRSQGPVSVSLLVGPPRLLSPFESLDDSSALSLSAGISTRAAELDLHGSKEGPAMQPVTVAEGLAASAESDGTSTSTAAAQQQLPQQLQQQWRQEQEQQQQHVPSAPSPAGHGGLSPAGSADMRQALAMQAFLEGHPSQLTYHGLLSLHEGLRDGQLAVFFRWEPSSCRLGPGLSQAWGACPRRVPPSMRVRAAAGHRPSP